MNKIRAINPEQLASLLRTILQVVGGFLVARGYLGDADWNAIAGAALVLIPTVWGIWARKDSNLIKSAADVPGVEKIVAPGSSAVSDPNYPKVKAA